MTLAWTCFILLSFLSQLLVTARAQDSIEEENETPYYVYPCQQNDPEVDSCLTFACNHLASHFRDGIPELDVPQVEPIIIDEIQLALGGGPDGYRAIFRDIQAFGISNLTVTSVRLARNQGFTVLDLLNYEGVMSSATHTEVEFSPNREGYASFGTNLDSHQYQLSFFVPKITAKAWFRSAGVLFLVKASGGGDYYGNYEGVRAKVYFRAQPHQVGKHIYLSVEEMKMDFSVEKISMEVNNSVSKNAVVDAALNLMINTHAQELLKEMKPSLRKDLTEKMRLFTANLLARIPYDVMVTQ